MSNLSCFKLLTQNGWPDVADSNQRCLSISSSSWLRQFNAACFRCVRFSLPCCCTNVLLYVRFVDFLLLFYETFLPYIENVNHALTWNLSGTFSFGVLMPMRMSITTKMIIERSTAKSLMSCLIQVGKMVVILKSLRTTATANVPMKRSTLKKKTSGM